MSRFNFRRDLGSGCPSVGSGPPSPSVVPLGNGKGIALVGRDQNGTEQVWWDQLTPRSTANRLAALGPPTLSRRNPLLKGEVLFAHLSSNLNGDLLVAERWVPAGQ